MHVSRELIVAEWEEMYPDHRQKGDYRVKDGGGWCDAGDVPRMVQGFDIGVQ